MKGVDDPQRPTLGKGLIKTKPYSLILDILDGNAGSLGVLEGKITLGAVAGNEFHKREHDQGNDDQCQHREQSADHGKLGELFH